MTAAPHQSPDQSLDQSPGQSPSQSLGQSMVVAGVMSGTSADGIDAVVCRIGADAEGMPKIEVLGHRALPYPAAVRGAVLEAMAAESISVAQLSRLNWRLGALYGDAVESACAGLGVMPELVGCHGQTIYHQGVEQTYLGAPVRCTWQIGEVAVVAERLRCSVVSDFRPADLAAGGQGAPLVAMLDWVMFRSREVGRVLANLGGIGNVTGVPAGCRIEDVTAFDTGPGNMVIDGCMRRLYGREFDEGGGVARTGTLLPAVVERFLEAEYFSRQPPKSCGREEFGEAFCDGLIAACRAAGASDADVIATATALTVRSMVAGYDRFVAERLRWSPGRECVVAGGGTRNAVLVEGLRAAFAERGVALRAMEELGVAAEAKEAVAFALLAWLTWWGQPGNVVGATGARRAAVLGKVCFA